MSKIFLKFTFLEGTLAVSELMITKYPCLSLLAPKNAAHVSVISRIESPYIAELKNSVQNYEGEMVVLKAEKQARDQETRLRQTQEADYQKTLQADQLRMQQKIEEERISKEKEQEKHEKAVALALAKDTAEKILQEVDQMEKDDIFKIRVKMPSGLQLQQEFSSLASIRHVRALVLVQDEIKNNQFSLTSQFPTKIYLNEEESLASAFGANKNQILFIKLNSEEESEDTSSESE